MESIRSFLTAQVRSTDSSHRAMHSFHTLGRLLLSLIFLYSGFSKLLAIFYGLNLTLYGFPPFRIFIYVATGIEIIAGSCLVVRFWTRASCGILIVYLLTVTFFVSGGIPDGLQLLRVFENVAIVGGLVSVIAAEYFLEAASALESRNTQLEEALAARPEVGIRKIS